MKNLDRWIFVFLITSIAIVVLLLLKDMKSPTSDLDLANFDQANFDESSSEIDNTWFPLKPGTQWVYEGKSTEEGEEFSHRVIFTVTDLTKVIGDVRTVVAWDQDFSSGELVETELAFFAQDKEGVVWHLGQYPEEYEEGKFIKAPAWIHGLEDARAGITMKKDPKLGEPSYSQGWGPKVNWTDRGQVSAVGEKTCVAFGCYENVLVIQENSAEEPDAFQLKYYAQGVGNVRVGWRGEDATQEELELVDFKQLSPEDLEEVRLEAIAIEKRAYEKSNVYSQTQPIQQSPNPDNQ